MELIDFCRISSDTKYKKNMKINFGCNMKTYGKKIWEPNEPIQFFIREAEMCLDNNLLCYNESQKNLRHCGNLPSYIGLCSKWQYYDRIWVHLFDPSPTPTPTHTHKTHTHTVQSRNVALRTQFQPFCSNSTLFWVGGGTSLVLLISLIRS